LPYIGRHDKSIIVTLNTQRPTNNVSQTGILAMVTFTLYFGTVPMCLSWSSIKYLSLGQSDMITVLLLHGGLAAGKLNWDLQ
jgi:hypothetical protein